MSYKDPVWMRNGFKSHEDFVETVKWLRFEKGLTLDSIARVYNISKVYVNSLCNYMKPKFVVNRRQ